MHNIHRNHGKGEANQKPEKGYCTMYNIHSQNENSTLKTRKQTFTGWKFAGKTICIKGMKKCTHLNHFVTHQLNLTAQNLSTEILFDRSIEWSKDEDSDANLKKEKEKKYRD